MLYAIAAMDRKGCIGKAGELPWRIPADLAMFKKLTEGCIVLMGRKTYEYFAAFWPKMPEDDPFGGLINNRTK